MISIVTEYLQFLEGYTQSTIRRSRTSKIRSTTGAVAISIARTRNDPLYLKMMRAKKIARDAKRQIERKYKGQSMSKARQLASKPR